MLRMECPEHVDFIQRTLFKQKAFCLSIMITLVKKSPGRPFVQIISSDKKQIKDRSIVFLWSLERCWKRCEALYSYWEQMRKLKALVPNPISLESLYLINHVACHCFSQEPMVEGEKECSFSLWKRRAFKLSLKSPWKSLFWELVSTHMRLLLLHFSPCPSEMSLNLTIRFHWSDVCMWGKKRNIFLEIKEST